MPNFPIVDSHVHFWNPTTLRYPWLDGNATLNRPFLPADFQVTCGPVEVGKIVFVECGAETPGDIEAAWVAELAQIDPRIVGIVARAEMDQGAVVQAELERLAANPLVKGIRRLLQGESEPGYCLRPDFVTAVRLLPRFNLSFDICIRHPQMGDAIELVRRCPDVSFILDHIGKPGIKEGLLEPWQSQIHEMASLPNVACKVSGMATEADHARWTPEDLKPYLDTVIEAFGFGRVLFGGDWPVATLATDYPRWVETLDHLLVGWSEDERKALYTHNSERVYRV